jgi:hypothetical protein
VQSFASSPFSEQTGSNILSLRTAHCYLLSLCLYKPHYSLRTRKQLSCYVRDAEAIQSRGFLTGYNESVWIVILLQAAGGLVSVTVCGGVL